MANLWATNWTITKHEIRITKNNFDCAISMNNKEEAIRYFEDMKYIFVAKTCLNIASFFQKKKANFYKKKVLGKMKKKLIQKGWGESIY